MFLFTQSYPGEELLLVYDYEFKYGQNFYLCLTEEAKEQILHVRSMRTLSNVHML